MNFLVDAVIIIAVLAIVVAYLRGRYEGRRYGRAEGIIDATRQLLRSKDQECWTGARYLEVDTFTEAKTERVARVKL